MMMMMMMMRLQDAWLKVLSFFLLKASFFFFFCFFHLPAPIFTNLLQIQLSISSSFPPSQMGQPFREYLPGPRIYCCSNCKSHAAAHDQIYAKTFQGRFGRAYLFNNVVNVCLGPREDRMLMTGMHTVNDIHCSSCYQILGWRYEKAYEEREKYKEGKYIMEKARMTKENW